ncbi:MAG: hypothetical protein M1510_09110 [Nitrospirae bacterium]|nr:hypothetical protein [Nitrospirota bacterium]
MARAFIVLVVIMFAGCSALGHGANVRDLGWPKEAKTGNVEQRLLWSKPVIQIVKVPATIRNGLYIPEHTEYVIVRPGEYIINEDNVRDLKQYELERVRAKYNIPLHMDILSPSGGSEIVIASYRHSMHIQSDTVIDIKDKPFLFKNIDRYYALFRKEPVRIGKRAYAFAPANGGIEIMKSEDQEIKTMQLGNRDKALVTADGYILRIEKD